MADIDMPLDDYIKRNLSKKVTLNRSRVQQAPATLRKPGLATSMKVKTLMTVPVDARMKIVNNTNTDARAMLNRKVDARTKISAPAKKVSSGITSRLGPAGKSNKTVSDMRMKLDTLKTIEAKKSAAQLLTARPANAVGVNKNTFSRSDNKLVRNAEPRPVKKVVRASQPQKIVKTIHVNPKPAQPLMKRSVQQVRKVPVQRVIRQAAPGYRPVRQTVVYRQRQPQQVIYEEPMYEDEMDGDMIDDGVIYEDDLIDDDMYEPVAPQPLMRRRRVMQRPVVANNMMMPPQQPYMQQPMQQPMQQQTRYVQQQINQQQYVPQNMNMGGMMNGGGMSQNYMMQQQQQPPQLGRMFTGGQQQQYVPQSSYSRPMQQQAPSSYRPSSSRYSSQSSGPSRGAPSRTSRPSQPQSSRSAQPSKGVASRISAPPKPAPIRAPVQKKVIGTRVSVTNLHAVATADDIEELFENIGKVTSAKMVTKGSVVVIFRNAADAQRSVDVYHNRKLDGQPMNVKILGQVYEK